MITPKRTAIVMISIYGLTFLSYSPSYYRTVLNWKFDIDRNKTILWMVYSRGSAEVTENAYLMHSFIGFAAFIAIVIFTIILIHKLRQKSTWRRSVVCGLDTPPGISNRDRKAMTMITLIACIFIVCYIPNVILCCATFVEPEFSMKGEYINIFFTAWSFSTLFETINGSVNIFLYIKMSTNYRKILIQQFPCLNY